MSKKQGEPMTAVERNKAAKIKSRYHECVLSYEDALDALVALGYSEGAADDFLFEKPYRTIL